MNVNKKLDRFKQWAGERMGGEVKTSVSDHFKALEIEVGLRHEGMEKMQKSMNLYMKAVSKRTEIEGKEKTLPIAYLGGTMISHGDDFELDSEFGQCLTSFGRTQERVARAQEAYITDATATWLESLERSLVQMKEYQAARKRLETRRLAYDTSLSKMQKAKREDFRVEEELRSQKAKYEETEDDVYRRMLEVKESESESMTDLTGFLDAQLAYHEKCREALILLKSEWPHQSQYQGRNARPGNRSRANTARGYLDRTEQEDPPVAEVRPVISSSRTTSYRQEPSGREYAASPASKPTLTRTVTMEPTRRDISPMGAPRLPRMPSDSLTIRTTRTQLRPVDPVLNEQDVFADDSTFYTSSSPDRSHGELSTSPATSHGSGNIPFTSASNKKAPPPPPPSRATKPGLNKAPPPPPPIKKTVLT